jgi:release factor glutamine methyltransferase
MLARAGVDSPALDAELLLADALGVGRERLVMDASDEVPAGAAAGYEASLRRRCAREPVAYIIGRKPFRSIELAVDPRVLIPRPETELLVEVGLEIAAEAARVADVGTGSGAVALALAGERPDLEVVGIDVSADALEVARANASRLGLTVEFVCADLLGDRFRYDAVLANLPYVADGASLAPEIALYEPPGALFAGPDGLEVIRRLVAMLDSVPVVALEIGFGQAAAVSALLRGAGFTSVTMHRDLAGHERVVVGRR